MLINDIIHQMSCLSIALVSDFYLPDLGGVELQIKQLAKYLKQAGHKVIVITHCRPDYFGIMQIQGIKTYYLPWGYSSSGAIYPTFFMQYIQAKEVLLRQKIEIVHTHQSSSTLGASYAIYAYHLGIKVVHTQHSLFNIRTNTYLNFTWVITTTYKFYSKFICVSRAVRNNLILRSYITSNKMVIIPNAVSPSKIFVKKTNNSIIRIVVVGRLVYRRGVDLLLQILPQFCQRNRQGFIMEIIGDGPKMKILRLIIDKYNLHSMVKLHGGLPNDQTLQIVSKCNIFLSTALTESFGIALVQAAHFGLQCVSTNVGGVSEILPQNRLHTVDVNSSAIILKLEELMNRLKKDNYEKAECQKQVYYKRQDCFERVIQVYQQISASKFQTHKKSIVKDFILKGSLPAVLLILVFAILYLVDISSKSKAYLSRKLKFQ